MAAPSRLVAADVPAYLGGAAARCPVGGTGRNLDRALAAPCARVATIDSGGRRVSGTDAVSAGNVADPRVRGELRVGLCRTHAAGLAMVHPVQRAGGGQ